MVFLCFPVVQLCLHFSKTFFGYIIHYFTHIWIIFSVKYKNKSDLCRTIFIKKFRVTKMINFNMKPSLLKIFPNFTDFQYIKNFKFLFGNREETTSCFPQPIISVQINISLLVYYPLQKWEAGFISQNNNQEQRTYRLSRTLNWFKIYDKKRATCCPGSTDTTLEVKMGNFGYFKKDNAKWFDERRTCFCKSLIH